MRSIVAIAVVPILVAASPASSQTSSTQAGADLKKRCAQLIAYYDRYGRGRSTESDGSRNMTRIGASVDCSKGRYEEGIRVMEDLLTRKRFTIPPWQGIDDPREEGDQ